MAEKVIDGAPFGVQGGISFPSDMSDDAISNVLIQQYGSGGDGAGNGQSSVSISPPPGTPTVPKPSVDMQTYPVQGPAGQVVDQLSPAWNEAKSLIKSIPSSAVSAARTLAGPSVVPTGDGGLILDVGGGSVPVPHIRKELGLVKKSSDMGDPYGTIIHSMAAALPIGGGMASDLYEESKEGKPTIGKGIVDLLSLLPLGSEGGVPETSGIARSLLSKATKGGIAPRAGGVLRDLGDNIPEPNIGSLMRHPVSTLVRAAAGPAIRGAGKLLTKDPFFLDRKLNVEKGPDFQSAKGEYPYSIFSDDAPPDPLAVHTPNPVPVLRKAGQPRAAGWQTARTEPTAPATVFETGDPAPVPIKVSPAANANSELPSTTTVFKGININRVPSILKKGLEPERTNTGPIGPWVTNKESVAQEYATPPVGKAGQGAIIAAKVPNSMLSGKEDSPGQFDLEGTGIPPESIDHILSRVLQKRGYSDILDDQAVREEINQRLGLSEEGAGSLAKKEMYGNMKPDIPKSLLIKKAKRGMIGGRP